jgi:GNAT superfamily N-acetyltransferase
VLTPEGDGVIRPARPDDVAEIVAMVGELAAYERAPEAVRLTPTDLSEALFGPAPAVFAHVAEQDCRPVGFAIWFRSFSTWTGRHGIYLEDLFVRPAARGQGHGRELLTELARICVRRGYTRLEWAVLDWNDPAIGFYRALGAVGLDSWTVHRLDGAALAALGAIRDQAP